MGAFTCRLKLTGAAAPVAPVLTRTLQLPVYQLRLKLDLNDYFNRHVCLSTYACIHVSSSMCVYLKTDSSFCSHKLCSGQHCIICYSRFLLDNNTVWSRVIQWQLWQKLSRIQEDCFIQKYPNKIRIQIRCVPQQNQEVPTAWVSTFSYK